MELRQQVIQDLKEHFGTRLRRVMQDTIDTCIDGDLTLDDSVEVVFSALLFELTLAARAARMSKTTFMDLTGFSFDKLNNELARIKTAMKARSYQ